MTLTTAPLPNITEPAPTPSAAPKARAAGDFTDRLLDIKDVTAKTRISRSKIYQMMSEGLFPRAISVSVQMVRWRESTIDGWVQNLEARANQH